MPWKSPDSWSDIPVVYMKDLHLENPRSTVWIAGDMNLPYINLESSTIRGNSNPVHTNQLPLDLIYDIGSEQAVTFPTTGRNILDLFITIRASLIEKRNTSTWVSVHDIVFVQATL